MRTSSPRGDLLLRRHLAHVGGAPACPHILRVPRASGQGSRTGHFGGDPASVQRESVADQQRRGGIVHSTPLVVLIGASGDSFVQGLAQFRREIVQIVPLDRFGRGRATHLGARPRTRRRGSRSPGPLLVALGPPWGRSWPPSRPRLPPPGSLAAPGPPGWLRCRRQESPPGSRGRGGCGPKGGCGRRCAWCPRRVWVLDPFAYHYSRFAFCVLREWQRLSCPSTQVVTPVTPSWGGATDTLRDGDTHRWAPTSGNESASSGPTPRKTSPPCHGAAHRLLGPARAVELGHVFRPGLVRGSGTFLPHMPAACGAGRR